MNKSHTPPKATRGDIMNYAYGEGVNSLSNNSMGNFGLLFLTVIIGLEPVLAGIALSVSMFWDAVTDPLMGHISDNTRSRWGRRHPYLILGGIGLACLFIAYWTLPQALIGNTGAVMLLLIVLQLLFKTFTTIYYVPFTALGFEMCPDYERRSDLQGKRWFVNQTLNFIFGAGAWILFFPDVISAESGETVNGSLIASNYVRMGLTIALVIAVLTLYSSFKTRPFGPDNRDQPRGNHNARAFMADFASIFRDKLAVFVIAFSIIAGFGIGLMAQTQMYTYVYFMNFSPYEKTFTHGGGMIATALAGLLLPRVVHRLDKKPAGFIGMAIAISGGVGLFLVFSTGLLVPRQMPLFDIGGQPFHMSTVVFGILQMMWWGGLGLVVPLSWSMIADVAGINSRKSGQPPRNATYASVMSFSQKASYTVTGMLIAAAIQMSGFVPGAGQQTPEAVHNIANLTFLSGPAVMAIAAVMLWFYPVNRAMIEQYEKPQG